MVLFLTGFLPACRTSLREGECGSDKPCRESDDPCLANVCTPSLHCQSMPAREGLPCGPPSDCRSAHACLTGQCVVVAATDGMECAPANPCRDPGTCLSGICQAPAARPFAEPIWTRMPIRKDGPLSPIATDAAGNFYWQECQQIGNCAGAFLVSTDAGGTLRFRPAVNGSAAPIIANDLIVRAGSCYRDIGNNLHDGFVEARSTLDGELRWTLDLTSLLPPPPGTSCRSAATDIVFDGTNLYALIGIVPTTSVTGTSKLIALDPATGSVRWAKPRDGYWNWGGTLALIGDGRDNLYYRSENVTLITGSDGRERAQVAYLDFPAAVFETRLFGVSFVTGDGKMHFVYDAWDAKIGKAVYQLQPRQLRAMPLVAPVFGAGGGYAFDAGIDYQPGEAIVGFDPISGTVRFRTPLDLDGHAAAGTDMVLTARDSLLFVQEEFTRCDDQRCDYVGAHLREFSTAGAAQWTCALPLDEYRYPSIFAMGTVALGRGVVAIAGGDGAVRAYRVTGAVPAKSGWTGARGNMQRSGRPDLD